jgi:glycosyltransferase involved in cell wall biosynthesis
LRVLQINTGVNTGSTGRIAEDIGKLLLEKGHESYIAYGRGSRPSASRLIRIGKDIDVYLHGLKTALTDRHAFGSTAATKAFIKEIEAIRPDVIGMHNLHGYYLNIEVLFNYLSKKNIPLIWTLHDCWSFTGHCTYFDDINCAKWQTGCGECPKLKKYPASYVSDSSNINYLDKNRLFNSVNMLSIVVPSAWLGGLVKQSFLSQWPVHVIHNGVDINVFKPVESDLKRRLGLDGKKVVMGCASIWDKRKGLDDLVQLKELLPEDYTVVAVGLSEKQQKALPGGMIGVTRTERVQQLVEYYNMASVFVNPTYQDNFPTTNIEALACGTPVVTYETGGSPEAVDAHTGVVVPKGDLKAMASAIVRVAAAEETYRDPCRKRATNHFNKNTQFIEYVRICEEMSTSKIYN